MTSPAHLGRGGEADGVKQEEPFDPSSLSPTLCNLSILPRAEAGQHEYIAGPVRQEVLRGENSRYALAIQVIAIDVSKLPCTCFAQGECPYCRYSLNATHAREARMAWR